MPEPRDGRYLTRELFYAEHAALIARVAELEQATRELAGAERIHRELADRISSLEKDTEEQWKSQQTAQAERRSKVWQTVLAIVTGLVLPLVLLGAAAIFHLATRH